MYSSGTKPALLPHIFQYSPLEGKLADLNLAMEGAVLDCAPDVHKLILKEFAPIKLWITVLVRYEPANPLDDPERHGFDQYLSAPATRVFRREGIVNLWESPYADDLRLLTERIKIHNAKFIREKSGLILAEIKNLYFRACRYDPLRGSSWKPLPGFLQRKHCIVNIQNKDNRCFGYALLYFLIKKPNRNLQRSSLYTDKLFKQYHLDSLPYPISPNDVNLYEDLISMNINIFTFFDDEGKARHPYFISKKQHPSTANLLYWSGHYAPISNVSSLFSDIFTHEHRLNLCLRCLGNFYSADKLARHKELCTREDYLSVVHVLPTEGSKNSRIEFNAFSQMTNSPFVIYADLESLLPPIKIQMNQSLLVQQHRVCAAAGILCSTVPKFNNRLIMSVGSTALHSFFETLIRWEKECLSHIRDNPVSMNELTRDQKMEFKLASKCYLCQKPFVLNNDIKVRDHDHISGLYLGAAHQSCNLNRNIKYLIPVFMHNFKKYDAHLLLHQFKFYPQREIRVIGQNMENYL